MKKNNPRKPFFGSDKQEGEGASNKKSPRGSSFSKKENSSDSGKGKFFGKKEGAAEKKPFEKRNAEGATNRGASKGRFFKEQPAGTGEGRPARGDKSSDWKEKKTFGDSPNRFKKGDSRGEKKFGGKFNESSPRSARSEKPGFKKGEYSKPSSFSKDKGGRTNFSEDTTPLAPGERRVYKGRGKDQKPIFGVESKPFTSDGPTEKRGFGKNRSKFVELNADRPTYDFDKLPQKKKQKEAEELIRLNKYVANSGICSRREADELISKGLVVVNGVVVQEMGYKVKKTDHVVFQGKKINPEKPVYVLLNKPKDFITTTEDPMERKTVMKLVENACEERIFPVGRLDRNTTGLLVFTNDGELAAKLSHPSNEIKKIYQVTLDKPLTAKDEEDIREGLTLEDGDAKVDDLQVLSKDRAILGLEIHIGRNRIVRRIFSHLGYEVVALDRVMYAGLDKKDLKRGHYRFLSEQEVIRLKYYI
uniref:pseudouridine synthase n=1 Tax=Algoriphagus sp. TaxID=1872435 RepID=UPI004047C47F